MSERIDQEGQLALMQAEIASLRQELARAQATVAAQQAFVSEFAGIGTALSAEKDHERILEMIVELAQRFTNADGCTLYVRDENDSLRFTIVANRTLKISMGGRGSRILWPPVQLKDKDGRDNHKNVSAHCALTGEIVKISDVYSANYDFQGTKDFDAYTGYRSRSMLVIPLRDNDNEIIGVVQLLNAMDRVTNQVVDFRDEEVEIVASLASQAAIAITNMRLIHDLENLLQAIVKMVAAAIDEKSPYTAGHIQRVVSITEEVVRAIDATRVGPFAGINFSGDQLKEISMAAWLHDVGKIVTPEYVVDKPTKLTTLYDRLGLVEYRIELLKKEALVRVLLRQLSEHGVMGTGLEEVEAQTRQLDEYLDFLKEVNQGVEFLSDAAVVRVHELANLRFECLGEQRPLLTANEVENLTVRKGTLTREEREIINDHVVVAIKMLKSLLFPRKLRHVPSYVVMHHEKLDGSGYPLGLTAEQIPLAARALAVADIFEALTSSDRPYKKANSVADVMQIIGLMVKDGHVDKDICDLMVESGLVTKYVREKLPASQWSDFEWQGKKYTVW